VGDVKSNGSQEMAHMRAQHGFKVHIIDGFLYMRVELAGTSVKWVGLGIASHVWLKWMSGLWLLWVVSGTCRE
jgi:hypothetical protein